MNFEIDPQAQAVMACVDALEQSDVSAQPDLRSYLADVSPDFQQAALMELVKVDLERQWEHGNRKRVQQYLDEFPEIGKSDAELLELLNDEFDIRSRFGEQPSVAEYRSIHPHFSPTSAPDTDQAGLETEPLAGADTWIPEAAPQRIGRYQVVRRLGEGGFGVVYLAYDAQLERQVAIKLRRNDNNGPTGLSDDLLHEARSIANLDHPGIVKLLEAGTTDDGQGYVVYDYIDGGTLSERISSGDYGLDDAVEWVAKIADALQYAHKRGVIHRDIKPANILIDMDGQPKLVDFGLARRDDSFFTSDAGVIIGTLAYMSPEQAQGTSHWASSQSDLYTLGVVLYELLCGRRPFKSNNQTDLLEQVQLRPPPPPRSIDDSIPQQFEDICLKALSKSAELRFRTGADMAAALRAAPTAPSRTLGKLALAAAGVVAIVVISVLAAGFVLTPPEPPNVAEPPEFSSFDVMLTRGETGVYSALADQHLPLAATDRLEVQATLDPPAYTYLLLFDQTGAPKLLWPPASDTSQHDKTDRVIYPPLSEPDQQLSVADADGASLIVVLASGERLADTTLTELLQARLSLGVSEQAASHATNRWLLADPAPQFNPGIPLRSKAPAAAAQLRVSDDFKNKLRAAADAYYGIILSHRTTSPVDKE